MGNGSEDSNATLDGSEELIKGSAGSTESEDWLIECSDDETYNPTGLEGGVWEPDPTDIKTLYERLAKGETLELEWTCPGRRSPSPEKLADEEATTSAEPEEKKEEERVLPKGFEFDEEMDTPGSKQSITPRRTPGSSKTPRSVQKRVARMDKIMNDILRHKKLEAAVRKAAGPGQRKQMTPTGQRKLLMGGAQRKLPLSPGAVRKSPGTPTGETKLVPTTSGDNKPLPTSSLEAKLRPTPSGETPSKQVGTSGEENVAAAATALGGTDIDTKFGTLSVDQSTASNQNVP